MIKIANAENELRRCGEEVATIRESELRLKRELTDLRDEIFARPEEETITVDNAHVTTDGEHPSTESERPRSWKERQKQLRTV
jgi:hypothetical protein